MSRVQKIAVCVVLSVISLIVVVAIATEMLVPRTGPGFGAAAPVTTVGWIQLVLSLLSAASFSSATIWQTAAAWLESRGTAALKKIAPNLDASTSQELIDVAKIATMIALIKGSKDDTVRQQWTKAARLEFDALRDAIFPSTDVTTG